ncbi:MAG: helix-turn-helix domain-containing protein [Elusimicrobia bacterium]|nr:helix-turn-helix domain-containing protein [Elusimicrobiota bacterium]
MKRPNLRLVIARKIRKERLKRDWSQEELAEKIDVHPSFIGQIERGIKTISLETLETLCLVFEIRPSQFIGESSGEKIYRKREFTENIVDLLKGYSAQEQKVVYQTIKQLFRQKRKMRKFC